MNGFGSSMYLDLGVGAIAEGILRSGGAEMRGGCFWDCPFCRMCGVGDQIDAFRRSSSLIIPSEYSSQLRTGLFTQKFMIPNESFT